MPVKTKKRRLHIRPRPFRLAGYILWLLIMLIMYVMFRSFLLLFFTVFLCVIPWIFVLGGYILAKRIRVAVEAGYVSYLRQGDEVSPTVRVYNPLWIGSLDVSINIRLYNELFDRPEDAGKLKVSLPVVGRDIKRAEGVSELMLPLTIKRIGGYRIDICDYSVQDYLGIVRFCYDAGDMPSHTAVFQALPTTEKYEAPDPETISAGMTEVEESNRKGSDFSEVSDIREYMPGDRIRDIHWKLSARQDELMVKLRTQLAGMELVAVIVPDEDDRITEEIYTYSYRELRSWSEGETDIELRVYSRATYGFETFLLDRPGSVDEAFADLVRTNYHEHIAEDGSAEALESIITNLYPYLNGYIRFGIMSDNSVGYEVQGSVD